MKKRLILLISILTVIFMMSACSDKNENNNETTTTPTEVPVTVAPTVEPTKEAEPVQAEPTQAVPTEEIKSNSITEAPLENQTVDVEDPVEAIGSRDDSSAYSYYDEVTDEDLIIGFTDTDDAAQYSAEHTIKALMNYDSKRYLENILVINEDNQEYLDDLCFQLDIHKKHSIRKEVNSTIRVEAIGGYRVPDEELLTNSWYVVSAAETEFTDYQCFCVKAEADVENQGKYVLYFFVGVGKHGDRFYLASLDDYYITEVERYENGIEYYDFFNEIDPELADFEDYFYTFRGDEKPEEIAALFVESTLKLDIYTMISCMAVDEDCEEDAVEAIMYYRTEEDEANLEDLVIKIGESRTPTEEEIDELDDTYLADISKITDKVIVTVEASYTEDGEANEVVMDICVGKHDGVYRVAGMIY